MFRIILPVLFLSALLIFGDDGSRIIMGVTESASTLQDRTSARFNAETLINKEQAVLQFGSSDGADQIEASVTQLYGMNSPGEFFVVLDKKIDESSHDGLQGIAQQIISVVYRSNHLLDYGEPDKIYVKAYGDDAICWELGRIPYYFLPYRQTRERDASRIVVWREKTPWADLWLF